MKKVTTSGEPSPMLVPDLAISQVDFDELEIVGVLVRNQESINLANLLYKDEEIDFCRTESSSIVMFKDKIKEYRQKALSAIAKASESSHSELAKKLAINEANSGDQDIRL